MGTIKMRKTVLVVDDDPVIRAVLTGALEAQGYQVLTSVDGPAIEVARAQRPDLILLDLMMPGMDGPEVSRHLRADPRTAAIPIVALSAERDLPTVAARMGVDDFVAKPVDLPTLSRVVARWADHDPSDGDGPSQPLSA
jgi:CheY-like chemotaxis protein